MKDRKCARHETSKKEKGENARKYTDNSQKVKRNEQYRISRKNEVNIFSTEEKRMANPLFIVVACQCRPKTQTFDQEIRTLTSNRLLEFTLECEWL